MGLVDLTPSAGVAGQDYWWNFKPIKMLDNSFTLPLPHAADVGLQDIGLPVHMK